MRNEAGVSVCVSESGKDQIFVLGSSVVRTRGGKCVYLRGYMLFCRKAWVGLLKVSVLGDG